MRGRRPQPWHSHGFGRQALALLAATALAVVAVGPVAGAGSPRGYSLHTVPTKRTVADTHIGSARALAAAEAAHPRASHAVRHKPRLHVPTGRPTATRSPTGGLATGAVSPAIVGPPDVAVATQFAGLGMLESGNVVPADPWVAVNSGYVVQVVNSKVRMSNRSGVELLSLPHEVLFGLPPDVTGADARIIWDATHGRWVGEVMGYTDDFSENYLSIAVSDSSDPTAGWRLIIIGFTFLLPDYPSIASSSDKIVVTDNLFDTTSGLSFIGGDFNVLTWSSITGGGSVTATYCTFGDVAHPRAAQVLSAASDVHVIAEDFATSDQVYVRLTGSGACPGAYVDATDLTTSLGLDAFLADGPPPSPRQSGPDTLDGAVDERPTDAVWQSGHMWWVSTFPATYDAGATWNDEVVLWGIDASTGAPSGGSTVPIQPGDGVDAYYGAIGLSRDGTVFTTYSQSSSSTTITWWANRYAGGGLGTPLLLDTSEAAFSYDRWGDYAGIAMDPVGTGAVWATHMLADGSGDWRTEVTRLLVDGDTPSTPGAPAASTLSTQTLGSAPRYKLTWGGSTDGASGAVMYRLEQSVDAAGFGSPTFLTGTSTIRNLPLGHTYQFRVAAFDWLGNISAFATGPTIRPLLYQSTTSKSGTWHTSSAGSYSGGSTLYSRSAGASASFKTTGVRSIGFVTSKGPSRGKLKVYIDGVLKATINTYSSTTRYRQLLYQITFSSPGTHTIKIVVVGTAGHPRVDVDAFLVLK